MAEISAAQVKDLREKTGAGMMECKKALTESAGDLEKAIEYLRKKGIAKAESRSGRATAEGLVHSYIHPGGKVGVLLEVNCETDFVARNEGFQEFVKNVSMHIAASAPLYVRREDVPAAAVAKEKELLTAQTNEENKAKPKPANVVEKIVEGKVSKFFQQICLLEQPYVKNPDQTIDAYLKEQISKIGENITLRRFTRYQLGEALPTEAKPA
jgi:elongation factor Ts